MCSGRLPPSNEAGTFLRAPVPLVPRPAVLPLDPSPRPTRVLAVLAPGAGRRWWTFNGRSVVRRSCASVLSAMSVDLLDAYEMRHGVHHAADLGTVLLDHHVAQALEPEAAQRVALVLLAPDPGAGLGHLQPRHQAPTPARARSRA